LIGLGVACADFCTPNMMMIASPITSVMSSRGVRFVDFSELRAPGTAVFMIVPEGDAERYKRVLSTFIGLANDCLRNGELDETAAPVLFNLDEIGNIYIPDLPAALGVGRGRKMTYALGYQNIAQLYHQYGTDGGDAVLGSVGAMVFLPGIDHRTADYASKRLGMTTALQAASFDVREGNSLDSERTSEVGRPLMDATEIRQMTKYKQAVAIISNAPPVRLTYPKFAKLENPPLSRREKLFARCGTNAVIAAPENETLTQVVSDRSGESPGNRDPWELGDSAVKETSFSLQDHRVDLSSKPLNDVEGEYDIETMDENLSPLFDDGVRRW
jgi:hypothetical protein